ncbi:hypothetical protein [Ktedonospora formicarum]|uniref:Uncharacterized protein n=1 Tax=Ktedonospora formicarum TaxID=2778364 RepID=A0A8J3MUF2_9CHLR|nr:hypothetical protein [Ktedonospora formicarum]GHO46558.1 hypothetical protein KSX_47210 [Ktedonospora formicarum]
MKSKAMRGTFNTSLQWGRWSGYAACAWALLFAAAHVYWACGGNIGLAPETSQEASVQFSANPWLYVVGWGLNIALFVIEALFPLTLVWSGKSQWVALIAGYVGMILFAMDSLLFAHEISGCLLALGVCALGIIVGLLRPRNQSVSRWMVLFATWAFGIGMSLYGCGYCSIPLWHLFGASSFLQAPYALLYGSIWLTGGILFQVSAWLGGLE